MNKIKIDNKYYHKLEKDYQHRISTEEEEKTFFELEFNYLGVFSNNGNKKELYIHSTKDYVLSLNKYQTKLSENKIILKLYTIFKNEYFFLLEKEMFEIDFNTGDVYFNIVFPFVVNYHTFKEHYKRLHLKMVNHTVRGVLEARFMRFLNKCWGKRTQKRLQDFMIKNTSFFFILTKKHNPMIEYIEDNYNDKDFIRMDQWKSYYD